MKKSACRNYAILLVLVLIFIMPGLCAYFFYIHPDKLGAATTNKGELLEPPILLSELKFSKKIETKAIAFPKHPKWHLLLWSPTACNEACFKRLDDLVRVRLALGRELYNVRIELVLGLGAPNISKDNSSRLHDQDVDVVRITKDTQRPSDNLMIFIANPDNYLVLAFQPSQNPDAIFHDIKHLLGK